MIFTSKKEVLERMGMVVEDDQHGNIARLNELNARALNRRSTTAVEVSAQGGPIPYKAPVAPPARVDRLDHANTPTRLHEAYMEALRERGQR